MSKLTFFLSRNYKPSALTNCANLWAHMDLNHEPSGYKPDALTNCAMRPYVFISKSIFVKNFIALPCVALVKQGAMRPLPLYLLV